MPNSATSMITSTTTTSDSRNNPTHKVVAPEAGELISSLLVKHAVMYMYIANLVQFLLAWLMGGV